MSSNDRESCVLFHGPSAQGRAASEAALWGRLVGTFGDPGSGLNAEEMRAAAATMSGATLGDVRGSVVVGPVDVLTQEGVIDALLKALEDADAHHGVLGDRVDAVELEEVAGLPLNLEAVLVADGRVDLVAPRLAVADVEVARELGADLATGEVGEASV